MRSEDRKPSKRVFPLLQNLDLDSVTFSQIQSTGNPISIEDMNEQEMVDLIIVNLARLTCVSEWDGLLEAGGGVGGSISEDQVAVGATTADEIEGNDGYSASLGTAGSTNVLKFGYSDGTLGYTRLRLNGDNAYVEFRDQSDNRKGAIGFQSTQGLKFFAKAGGLGAAEAFRITPDDEWMLNGSNVGTDGQVLTSGGSGAAVAWEDAALSTTAHSSAPASAGATGTAGQLAYDADYFYICIATDTWKRTSISTW